jgi:hypothetical protein
MGQIKKHNITSCRRSPREKEKIYEERDLTIWNQEIAEIIKEKCHKWK